ncbi:MAG: glycosyltransferase [Spirochaetes bacterium]|nr:glycosyltransferase [Spirochaetota bacterium]
MPKLSIITINLNNSQGLRKTIESVVSQTFTDFEYIVIDGGSTDGSVDVIRQYAEKITYWVSEPDTGIYNAMNKGIRKARGEYCVFLNSGDWLISSTTLHDVFIEIENYIPADIYYSDRVDSDGSVFKFPKQMGINYLLYHPISHQNSLIKRKLFLEHGFYNENLRLASDWEFFVKELWEHKSTFTYIKTNISVFDIDGLGSQHSVEQKMENISFFQNVFKDLSDTILEYQGYRRSAYGTIAEKYGNTKSLTFILKAYKHIFPKALTIMIICAKLASKIKKSFATINKPVSFLREAISSCFDKSIRIRFTNFGDIPHDFFLMPVSEAFSANRISYKTVKYYKPHIQFFSVFGKKKKLQKSKTACKVFFSGENTNVYPNAEYKGNCVENVSLSIGFDYIKADNYIRFPLWLLYYFSPNNTKDEIKKILDAFKKPYEKSKFCALVASHDKSGIKAKIYNDVSKIAYVNCPGRLLHNDNTLHKLYRNDKSVYLQQFKFNICPENSISPGYVTEKLFQSLYSGCIPIYNGWSKDPEPGIINPDIILWYDALDNSNNNSLLNEIKTLYLDEKKYKSFISKSFFCDTAVDKIFMLLQLYKDKLKHTVSESMKNIRNKYMQEE